MAKRELPHHIRLCIISRKFPIVGRAADHSYLWSIAKAISAKGHKVSVIANTSALGKSFVDQDGVKIYYLNEKATISEKHYQNKVKEKFLELHRQEPFDLVHSIDASGSKIIHHHKNLRIASAIDVEATNLAQIFAILGMRQESIGSAMSTGIAVAYKFLRTYLGSDRQLLKNSHGVFVSSPQQRLVLERHYLYPDRRIYNVAYGIEMTDLGEKDRLAELRAQLGLHEDTQVILTLTDMAEVQEIANLLLAFESVVLKKPRTRLVLVGNGPRRKEIEFEVYRLALGNMVIFTGPIKNTEVPDYISLCDIYITLSARSSGFDSSVLEAMAQKKLVIASEVSALASLIEDRKDGFLVRPADLDGIAQLLLELLNASLPILEIGDSARRKVLRFFEPEKMLSDTLNAYYEILQHSGLYRKRR